MPNTLEDKDWKLLLRRIKDGKCTPFLGAGACFGKIPLGSQIAREWAKEYNFPLENCSDLAQVAQFLAVTEDPMTPKEKMKEVIRKCLEEVNLQYFNNPDEPHGVLADLPLPVYITTNYDNFMLQALKNRNKTPRLELCQWNKYIRRISTVTELNPTVSNPLVFHLHGFYETPESIVLTEDDYLDFLVNISREQDLIPARVQEALAGTSLLFLGYRIADWNLRVLLRSLASYFEKSLSRAHVSVQLLPSSEAQKEKVQEYLDSYFGKLDIRVYWGDCREFSADLKRRWGDFNCGN
ncbi:MAG: SIR2 family protein [Candidatus Methanoperedens sp.]|nr:SIR2 family protein [Candidatus Methanoperedens sp.]